MRLFFLLLILNSTFVFSEESLRKKKFLADNTVLECVFDSKGNLKTLTSSDGSICSNFVYDDQDRLIEATTPNTYFSRVYSPEGDFLEERWNTGLVCQKHFDKECRLTSLILPGNKKIYFEYEGNLTSKITYGPYTHTFVYDSLGNLVKEFFPNQLGEIVHEYNPKGLETELRSPFFFQQNIYDREGKFTQIFRNGLESSFQYDNLGQLVKEGKISYTFDSQRRPVAIDGIPIKVNLEGQVKEIGEIKCKYDINGRLIYKKTPQETFHYTYNALSQLLCVETESQRISFIHDGLGRRITKIVSSLTPHGWEEVDRENYLYDEIWEIGTYTPEGQVKNLRIVRSENLLHSVMIEQEGDVFFPISTQQGYALCLIDSVGRTQESVPFSFFGKYQGPILHPWAYGGHRFDPETGLYYFGKRYYDPELLAWITPDPLGTINSQNLYQYLLNNPLSYIDLDGGWAVFFPIVGAAAKGAFNYITEAIAGTLTGWLASKAVDKLNEKEDNSRMEKSEGPPVNNSDQKKQVDDAKKEIERKIGRKLTKDEERKYHEHIHKERYNYPELVEEGLWLFNE